MKKFLTLILAVLITCSGAGNNMHLNKAHYVLDPVEEQSDLQLQYIADDNEYFNGTLPIIPIIYEEQVDEDDSIGLTNSSDGIPSDIRISSYWNRDRSSALVTLHHEECHVAVMPKHLFDAHGPQWQACMDSLYSAGAFKGLL